MVRFVAIGAVLTAVFAAAFAPAGLSRLALDQVPQVALLNPSGTLWSGSGTLHTYGNRLGTLSWDLQGFTIFLGVLSYDFTLKGQDLALHGNGGAGWNRSFAITATGRVGEAFVNRLMAPYDMTISGDLKLNDSRIEFVKGIPSAADGSASWDGGSVRYTLGRRAFSAVLPAMQLALGPGPEAQLFEYNGDKELMVAELQPTGFAKVAMTRRMTALANNPWPGQGDPDQVVVEVEEKIF